MSARLEKFLRNNVLTYRLAFSDLTSDTGATSRLALEIFGVANKHVKLRHVQVSKPSIAVSPFQLNKYSIGTTGTTGQSLGTPVPFLGTNSTYAGSVRLYTVNPSSTAGGTLVDSLQEIDVAATDVMNEHYGDDRGMFAPTLNGSTESFGLAVTTTGSVILNGYAEWTVEP